ncbi:MAG: M15 family metallopeptidase [Clostridia bacterium]|nr:M15 family metallopeptidase [Clostridia bacterium]
MNNRNDDRILRQISRRRPRRRNSLAPIWVLLGVAAVFLAVLLIILLPGGPSDGQVTDGTAVVTDTHGNTLAPDSGGPLEKYPGYKGILLSDDEVHRGDLILVNSDYEYVFPDEVDIVGISANKTADYKVAYDNLQLDSRVLGIFNDMLSEFASVMGRRDVIVNSGYRNYKDQESIYQSRKELYGEAYAEKYVQDPGYSEHHTGYALDMSVYTDEGVSMTFDKDPDFTWFYHAAHTYGFIRRYADHKEDITGIPNEEWHFRYVGKPHAYYMYANDLCLEEYIALLRSYPFEGEHLTFRDDSEQLWEMYFIPAGDSGKTEVYIPAEGEYTLSGNNVDGFIIAAEKKAE